MTAVSDEGMWLLNDPPREQLKEKYKFDLTDAWLENAMHASVRLNSGGCGGFVSPEGLLVTNHHVARRLRAEAQQAGAGPVPRRLLRRDPRRGTEVPRPRNQRAAGDHRRDEGGERRGEAGHDAGRGVRRPPGRHGARSRRSRSTRPACGRDVVTLYNGGLYHLYRYKKYTDVRLVFAPEKAIAGVRRRRGQLRVPAVEPRRRFFRAYENGKPAKTPHFFKWSETGPKENDLVFVTGHPGTTNRLETLAKLKHRRDVTLPYTLARLRTLEAALSQYGEQGPEKRRQAATDHHRVANARKAFSGQYQGLLDPKIMEQKKAQERQLSPAPPAEMAGAGTRAHRLRRHRQRPGTIEARRPSSAASRGSTASRNGPRVLQRTVRRSPGTASGWQTNCRRSRPTGSASTATPTSNR